MNQVENCKDTISINHNWFNGCNMFDFIWKNLEYAFKQVQDEISDCKPDSSKEEWQEMCQNLLRASHGMNYEDFFHLLKCVAEKRLLKLLNPEVNDVTFDGWSLGLKHAEFDLRQIYRQLKIFAENEDSDFMSSVVVNLMETIKTEIETLV